MNTITHEFDAYGTGIEEIVEALPDDEAVIKQATATLEFVAEAWIDGETREVDDGRHEFTIPLSELYTGNEGGDTPTDQWGIRGGAGHHHVSISVQGYIEESKFATWNGPFSIFLQSVEIPRDSDKIVGVPTDALARVVDAADEECRQLDDLPDVPEGTVEELTDAIQTVESALENEDTHLNDLYSDIDTITDRATNALTELQDANLDEVENDLRAIREQAELWEDS